MKVRYVSFLLFFASWLLAGNIFAGNNKTPLPADRAFIFSTTIQTPGTVQASWNIAPGYYLYRERLSFQFAPQTTVDIRLPQGEQKINANKRTEEVYEGALNIPIVFPSGVSKVKMSVDYQGCSVHGFCYPPTHQTITLNVNGAPPNAAEKFQALLTNQNSVRDLFHTQSLSVMLLIFAGLGLLLAFTPCVLPMIPILTSIIVGHKQPVTTKKAFFLSTTYVLGASVTYAIAGLIAASMGSSLQAWLQQPWIIAVVSGLFVVLSLSLFGVYDLRLPAYWQNRITAVSRKQEGGTYAGAFIMGMVSTLIVSPCVTAPLVGVLMYIAQTGNLALGAGALFALGIGMGIPLIILGVSAGKWLPKRGPWMIIVQKIFGLLMLGMALWLLSRVASLTTIIAFCGVLMFATAIYFGAYLSKQDDAKDWYHRAGWSFALLATLLMFTVAVPNVLQIFTNQSALQKITDLESFTVVHSIADLDKQLSLARAAGKPVMLDFYADWCESCVAMEKNVFSMPDVKKSIDSFILLRADLSENTAADEALLKNYEVIAPPTVLFFNDQGKEVNSHRIVGELSANEFMSRVNTFFTASCDKSVTC